MSSLYIIGNGFDLAHGVDTHYWNFRKYLEEQHYDFLQSFEKLYGIQHLDEAEYGYTAAAKKRWEARVYEELWSEFEKFMALPDIQSMIDFSTSIINSLGVDSGNIGIRDTMDVYWKGEYGYIKKLQGYVKEWVEQIVISNVRPKKKALVNNDSDYFFSFNYTRILEEIYHINQVLHIHGTIGANANYDPFMGHCNIAEIKKRYSFSRNAEETFDEGEASIQKAVADYLKEIYKDTRSYMNMNRCFFNRLHTVSNIVIIGWSAGNADIPYLLRIKESISEDAHWLVYYHTPNDRYRLSRALLDCGISDDCVSFEETAAFWDT